MTTDEDLRVYKLHYDAFRAAVRGIPTEAVRDALREFTSGDKCWLDYSKDAMADNYATIKTDNSEEWADAHRFDRLTNLSDLRTLALEHQAATEARRAESKARKMNPWAPILREDGTYCSPACGFGCTKAQHDEVHRLARELAERLGPGWKPDVWENGRWLYGAKHQSVKCEIHPGARYPDWEHKEGESLYRVYLNTNPQFIAEHTDPVEAVRMAVACAVEHAAGIFDACDAVAKPLRKAA